MTDTTKVTRGMRQLEEKHGLPMADLLRREYAAGLSQQAIADRLGTDRSTVSRWMARLGIEVRYVGRKRRSVA